MKNQTSIYYSLLISTSIINFMFFISGIDKSLNFIKVVNGLQKRMGMILPLYFYYFMIISAIVIEIVCPLTILYSVINRNKFTNKLGFYSSLLLIIFTILATLIYHFPPTTSAKYYPFMSNLSLIGGLSLMALVFYYGNIRECDCALQ